MPNTVRRLLPFLAVSGCLWAATATAATPDQLQAEYEALARKEAPGFAGLSAARGAAFFRATHGSDWSCATCHTANPAGPGRHARTGNSVQPLAPAANAERFTDVAKVEKWFRRNCGDVLGRACTAQEKGDVVAFLRSLK
jgi:cytochrome c peroxidase